MDSFQFHIALTAVFIQNGNKLFIKTGALMPFTEFELEK